ncbi:MAG: 16S rRNA (cytosine(1402)-N(4))-methyltransferase RsmH [Candidatus Zixiibacteriota bacterium]
MTDKYHQGVMKKEVVSYLITDKEGLYVDATLGGGDHAEAILKVANGVRVLATDRDSDAIDYCRRRFGGNDRIEMHKSAFADLDRIIRENAYEPVYGFLFDLGLSSHQIDNPSRGFSYDTDAKIDMRADRNSNLSAHIVLNKYDTDQLKQIFYDYAEIPYANKLVERIIENRPLDTTGQLKNVVSKFVPSRKLNSHLSRIFQAIRIEVNDELEQLKAGLAHALNFTEVGGRIVVISYHSLEDRIVKQFFAFHNKSCICPPEIVVCRCDHVKSLDVLTKKPIRPEQEEIRKNPRSRSALLRVAEKIQEVN